MPKQVRHDNPCRIAIGIALICNLLLGCGHSVQPTRISVVATIFPLADIAENVGRDLVDVRVLIPPGASPHVFEPSPQEFREFAGARLFVMVGAGFEFWAGKLVTTAATESLIVLKASEGADLLPSIGPTQTSSESSASELTEGNPHIWLDPIIAKKIAYQIADALVGLDPAHASVFLNNANEYASKLDSLDSEIKETVRAFRTTTYVAFHPAWSYFARRYGLKEVGIIEESPGRDPTPKQLKKIVEDIKKYRIGAVFSEPQFSPKVADAVAQEAGVKVLMLDPIGGKGIPGRDSYLNLMRYDLGVMKKAMG